MKFTFFTLALGLLLQNYAYADCAQMTPQNVEHPFREPALYRCVAAISGAESDAEGRRISLAKAEEAAAAFRPIALCRKLGEDHTQTFHSFCDPMSACTGYTTYLYYSCGG